MANFAVNCPDEVISRGNALIAKMAEGTDEKKAETLNRIFAIVEKSMDDVIMQENGIDTKGLDAALNDIRRMFQTASSNREYIPKSVASCYGRKRGCDAVCEKGRRGCFNG